MLPELLTLATSLTLAQGEATALPFGFGAEFAGAAVSGSAVAGLVFGALLLAVVTSFAKITILMSAVAYGLGTPRLPGGVVVFCGAVLLSTVVMWPIWTRTLSPVAAPGAAPAAGMDLGPLSRFLAANASQEHIDFFAAHRAAQIERGNAIPNAADLSATTFDGLTVWAPAFMLTELSEAMVGALFILLPFLVIDLVVANFLLALGMPSLPPRSVALPLKLLVFVAMGGWLLIFKGVLLGYNYT